MTAVKLTGKNNFAVKKLLTADGLTGGYLVYDPLACKKEGLLKFAIIGYNP
ncbi:MAG: hypothetical protein LBP22_07225 [Deltaproteobacteria bacterium]|nr:hypothetical protein [Deltaproteobacteria bacterium]